MQMVTENPHPTALFREAGAIRISPCLKAFLVIPHPKPWSYGIVRVNVVEYCNCPPPCLNTAATVNG